MLEKNNIEELFKEAFRNYEEPVNPELWTKISSAINTAPVPADPASVTTNVLTQGTSLISNIGTWIAGAAIVATTAAGIYYVTKKSPSTSDIPVSTEKTIISSDQNNEIFSNSESASISTESVSGTPVKTEVPAAVAQTTQKVSTTNNLSENSLPANSTVQIQPILPKENLNNPAQTSPGIVTQEVAKKEQTSESNSLSGVSSNSNDRNHLTVYPLSGAAPLTVNLNFDGEASKLEWVFGDGNSIQGNLTQHTFDKPGTYSIILKVYDAQGKMKQLTQTIEVQTDMQIGDIPNFFTPNNDGFNDLFTFETPGVKDLEVSIYDKSGKFVYKWTESGNGWDGKLNSGQLAPEGTYFYIIFATAENNKKHQQKGTITLKR